MLNILVPSNGPSALTFSLFERYQIPAPVSGVEEEVNDDVILKFENEEEAIIYARQLENMADEINDKTTTQYLAINDIIAAIRDDDFVQEFLSKE
ncbi:MAG TPA: hypothetical protein VFE53_00915 [Mucilaginibacter sp.]|jgi:hypothetical protein|nr:hypothetical protein [Mucilaginibacter sp.]